MLYEVITKGPSPTTPKAASVLTTSEKRPLCTLTFRTQGRSYDENLATLLALIDETPRNAVVLAPEVCLTGFDYEAFSAAADFALHADGRLVITSYSIHYTKLYERWRSRTFLPTN